MRVIGAPLALASVAASSVAIASACVPPSVVPIESRTLGGDSGPCVIAFLPGSYDSPERFIEFGFIEDLRDAGVTAEVVLLDAHLGYYWDATIATRLRLDFVEPAKRRGKARVFLVGVSIGGLGAINAAREQGDDIAGILTIAPFLGPKEAIDQIEARGGRVSERARGQRFLELWRFLESRQMKPDFYLAFGRADRLFRAHRILTTYVNPARVFVNGGGHDWRTWRELWRSFLRRYASAMCG